MMLSYTVNSGWTCRLPVVGRIIPILSLSCLVGCGPFNVKLDPVAPSFSAGHRQLPGRVAIDLSNLGVTKKTSNNATFAGSALIYEINCEQAFADSIINYAKMYFIDAFPVYERQANRHDWLLHVQAEDMRWWMGGGFLQKPYMRCRSKLNCIPPKAYSWKKHAARVLATIVLLAPGPGRNHGGWLRNEP